MVFFIISSSDALYFSGIGVGNATEPDASAVWYLIGDGPRIVDAGDTDAGDTEIGDVGNGPVGTTCSETLPKPE
jgi:hypothetical protein